MRNFSEIFFKQIGCRKGCRFAVSLISLSFASSPVFHKFGSSNINSLTRKTPKIKKCPISRANIVHFDTLGLYQNVNYKMGRLMGLEPMHERFTAACVNHFTIAAR